MYSDRVAGKKASRPALDTTSRLFQHITDNQEDRRLFEEASVQLYDATPDANVAKRHEVLKAKINGKIPQPWMSMTRQVNGQASSAPGLAVAPCYQSSYQLSLTRSASPEASSAAEGIAPHHHAQSGNSVPYSEGLFGRQRAAKRKAAPAAPPPPHQHSGSTADRQQATKSFKASSPDVDHHDQMSQAAQHALAALDRVNSRRGQTPTAAIPAAVQPQQHLDALDRFNARKGYSQPAAAAAVCFGGPQSAADHSHTALANGTAQSSIAQVNPGWSAQGQAPPRGSLRADQRPHAQLSHRQEAQRPLDALDLFNMRRKAPNVGAETSAHGAATGHQQPPQQAQMVEEAGQPILDGLDRFNVRKGRRKLVVNPGRTVVNPGRTVVNPGKTDVNPGKMIDTREDTANESQQSHTTSVQPEQVSRLPAATAAAMAESSMTTHTPDALDRVNCLLLARRNSRKRASTPLHHSSASPEATQTSTHLLTDAKMGVAGQIASGSDQADINDHSMREAGGLQAREQGSAVSEVFGSGLRSAAAWQGGAQTACRGAHQGLNTAGGQKALVPKHKRMRAFDSDIAVECEQQQLNVVKRNRPVSENGVAVRAVRPETVAQTGTVFKRLG